MKERGKEKKTGISAIIIIVIIIIIVTIVMALLISSKSIGKNVALIPIEGIITTSGGHDFMLQKTASSDEIIKNIEDAVKNPNIKAIIFEINSPGGSAVASSEIAEAIEKAKQKKLTVALIREQGTSGAYWIASSCNYIIAHPLSFTGSIGVVASYLEFSGLLERYNVTYERLTKGEHKDVMSPFRELTEEEREAIMKKLDIIYENFILEVSKNRGLPEKQVRELANGMFYLGKEAKELDLVDQLGTKKDAIDYIEVKLGIKAKIKEYKKGMSFLDFLASSKLQQTSGVLGLGANLIDKSLHITP